MPTSLVLLLQLVQRKPNEQYAGMVFTSVVDQTWVALRDWRKWEWCLSKAWAVLLTRDRKSRVAAASNTAISVYLTRTKRPF
jgi:hypothetical protein